MKKILYLLVLFLIFSATVARADIFINGIDKNNSPYTYIDENTGKVTGFNVDAIAWIAREIGFEIEHKPMDWDVVVLELITGEIDMICSGMNVSEESKVLINFSEPYWEHKNVIIVHRKSLLSIDTILNTKNKLGVKRGTAEAIAIEESKKQNNYPLEIWQYADQPSMFKALLFGNISAVILNHIAVTDELLKENEAKILGTHGEVKKFVVAVRKDDNDIKNMINDGYKLLKADVYWQVLQDKYFPK